eukprot:1140729-Pelagomonas_calceolata.AAC.3
MARGSLLHQQKTEKEQGVRSVASNTGHAIMATTCNARNVQLDIPLKIRTQLAKLGQIVWGLATLVPPPLRRKVRIYERASPDFFVTLRARQESHGQAILLLRRGHKKGSNPILLRRC